MLALLRIAILPVIVVIAVITAWRLGYFELERRAELFSAVTEFRALPWALPVFILFWAVLVSLALPAALASLLGGAIFGTPVGALANWLAALVATVFAHTLSRTIVRAPLTRLLGTHRLLAILRTRADFLTLLRLRITPLAPFAVLDYVAGVAGVPMRRLVGATMIGVAPSVVAYAYVGAQIMASAQGSGTPRRAIWIAGIATAVMLLLSLLPLITRSRE